MFINTFIEHAHRREMVEELHSRPFSALKAPCEALCFAFMLDDRDAQKNISGAYAQLNALLRLIGAEEAEEGARVVVRDVPGLHVKWEFHTEFVSYQIIRGVEGAAPFCSLKEAKLAFLGVEWTTRAPGPLIAAVRLYIGASETSEAEAEDALLALQNAHLNPESVASAWMVGREALTCSDFRIDKDGFTRMIVLARPSIGPRRLGRVAQRMIELETYRALSMLALPIARGMSPKLWSIENELTQITRAFTSDNALEEDSAMLRRLTAVSAEIERLGSESAFRFSAARAYSTIVEDRIGALREERVGERATFSEFNLRRFLPAMRTCEATQDRLQKLASRVQSAANMLRTRVDVSLEAQNQALLQSMDRRAGLQLGMQQTVEGLSVVAISYYAASLAGYLLEPAAKYLDVSKPLLKAAVTIPVIIAVWFFLRRLRKHWEK